jgi:membrane associated rhomboid family serine protease
LIPIKDINPTKRFPIVTVLLLIANVLVFLHQSLLGTKAGEAFVASFSLVPARLFHPDALPELAVPAGVTLFTSMFLHGSFLHIAGNMLYLWIFGNNIEDAMGRLRFTTFYALCGLAAAYSHALTDMSSLIPMLGASGAVSGVLGGYLLLYPRARVLTIVMLGFYIRTIEVPAMLVLGFWFLLQFVNAIVSSGTGGGVAWYAHVGGFVAGMALIGLFKRADVPFGGGRREPYL